jgi:pilus assembly protein Flp/PilA
MKHCTKIVAHFPKEKHTMNLHNIFTALHENESGQDLIEYALVCALIALGAVTGMKTVADYINNAFSSIGSQLSSAAA